MSCSRCEIAFQNAQPVVVTIQSSGSTALLYVQNQGRNIVHLRRILLCYSNGSSTGILYLRPPGSAITWNWSSAYLEQGTTALFYSLNVPSGYVVEAQAEYVELDGRSRSCAVRF